MPLVEPRSSPAGRSTPATPPGARPSSSSTASGCSRAAGTAGRPLFEEAGYAPLDAGLARRSRDRRRGQRAPRGVRRQDGRPGRRPLRRASIGQLDEEAGVDRPLVRRAADPDPRRPRAVGGVGRDRSGAVPRRAAAADLGARSRPRRCSATRPTATAPSRSPSSSSGTRSPTRSTRTRPRSCTRPTPCPAPGAPLFQAATRQLQPVDRGRRSTRRTPSAGRS